MTIPRTAIQPPDPAGVLPGPETARGFFQLAPEIHFLNHGSFGALPRSVQEAQDHWRARIEAHPIKLLGRECPDLLKEALGPVADLVGARRDELCFVTNATEGINALLRSMEFAPGDELLTTNHVYNAIRQAMKYRARETGGSYVEVDVPLPIASEQQILDVIMSAVTDRTRLLIIDHITSPTAIVFPIEQLVSMARQRGIRIIIDGAHGPGMVPLELDSLGADAYVANLHKWICAPKGCAFMWVAPEHQGSVHPATISHYLDDGYFDEFSWQGTRDITAWLSAPAAIEFISQWGLQDLMDRNHQMAAWAHQMLC
ncbi:MAG: aminotransferase, partial [Phycisphaerae bacterium]|nr:aminotransferase [Phycisphaerae bacterium]